MVIVGAPKLVSSLRCQKIKSTNQHNCGQWKGSKFGPEALLVSYLHKLMIKTIYYNLATDVQTVRVVFVAVF
jgi:hypothetical protein